MANPFDQFDAAEAPAEASAAPKGGNPFDQFDPPVERQATKGTTAVAPFVGFNRGLANTLGAPVDLVNFGLRKAGLPVSDTPFGGSESIKRGLGLVGANPDDLKPASTTEKLLQGAGEGVAGAVVPEAGLAGLARTGLAAAAPRATEALQSAFGAGNSSAATAANATMGAAGGFTGTGAEELAPERYKPLANMAGSLVGGGAAALGTAGVQAGVRAAGKAVEGMALNAGSQERLAGKAIRESAQDPAAVSEAILDNPREIVPGSKPTTFQLTGDMGLGALERDVATASPEKFTQRRADQNEARVGELTSLQPTGAPEDVSSFLRQRLGEIDAQTQGAVDQAHIAAHTEAAKIGGQETPESYGASLRSALDEARGVAKAKESALWQAIDPDGKLAVDISPVQAAVERIRGGQSPLAKPIDGEEGAILAGLSGTKPVVPFKDFTAVRSRLNDAMSEELSGQGRTASYARMAQLRGAVEDAISRAVEGRAAEHNEAVAAGTMSPDETISAQLSKLAAERDAFFAGRGAEVARTGTGEGAGASFPVGTGRISSASGAQGQARSRSNDASNPSGIPLAPNFDEAAADRLRTASAATKDRARTYDEGTVGDVLKTRGQAGNFRLPDSGVPAKVFSPGPQGAEKVAAFRRAANDDAGAMNALSDYAASSLRRDALATDGTIDPKKLAAWRDRHQDALRAMPGLSERFGSAEKASQALADAAAQRKLALDTYQAGAIGKILKVEAPSDVTRTVGAIFGQKDAVQSLRRVAEEANKSPEAREGLRKAVADHIAETFIGNREAATTGTNAIKGDAFQTFVRKNRPALRQVFDEVEVGRMQAIADDIARANRSIDAVKLPGQSNTAQDVLKQLKKGPEDKGSLLKAVLTGAVGGKVTGGLSGAAVGAIGGAGKQLVGAMREAGMAKVSDLVRDAMLDPDLAATLLRKSSASPSLGPHITLANQLKRLSVFSAAQGAQSRGVD